MRPTDDARQCIGCDDAHILRTPAPSSALLALPAPITPVPAVTCDAPPESRAATTSSRACRTQLGWQYCRQRTPMPPHRGATLAASAASLAVALVSVLVLSYGLTFLEHRIDSALSVRDTAHRILGIGTAYAAESRAPLLIRSHHMPVAVAAGETIALSLGFKNDGEWAWVRGAGSTAILERTTPNGPSRFMASDWVDTMRAAFQGEATIAPGALALFTAHFRAPLEPGTYTDTFILRTLDGRTLAGSETEVTMVVTAPPATSSATAVLASDGAAAVFSAPTASIAAGTDGTDPFFIAELIRYPEEPKIRIGIDYVEPSPERWFPHVITSASDFRIVTESGKEVLTARGGTRVSVDFQPNDSTYRLKHGEEWYALAEPLRFIPVTDGALMELPFYTEPLTWDRNAVDNIFRGILEVRYVPSTERLWAINELPLEDYVRGIAETWDDVPMEFHKAQAVAARTFALYHIEQGGKYAKAQFILRNDARDQVYRGENSARRRPNLVAAVEATRGIVVTYDGDVVVTPYFAQSNGETKGWHEVWGGTPRAWLAGVEDPVCAGKREIGHGVGLAQRCAITLANQGWAWQSILHHYYQGIELRKIYE